MKPRHFAILLFSLASAHCAAQPLPDSSQKEKQEPFQFEMSKTTALRIETVSEGKPLAGVRVSVRTAQADRPDLLFQGITNSEGVVDVSFLRDMSHEAFDFMLHKPGFLGPYDDETQRAQLHILAPSSMFRRSSASLAKGGSIQIAMKRSGT